MGDRPPSLGMGENEAGKRSAVQAAQTLRKKGLRLPSLIRRLELRAMRPFVRCAPASLNYFAYNFVRILRTPRMTPAIAAGVTDRLCEVGDLVALLEATEREGDRAA